MKQLQVKLNRLVLRNGIRQLLPDVDTFLMSVRFSKKGVTYDMVLPISKNMPQSYNKYIGIRNEYAIRIMKKSLEQ